MTQSTVTLCVWPSPANAVDVTVTAVPAFNCASCAALNVTWWLWPAAPAMS